MIRHEIENLIHKTIFELQKDKKLESFDAQEILLEHPENPEHGDYSTNVALVLAKKLGKNPREIAEQIVSNFDIRASDFLDKVEIAGPGFINFFLSHTYLIQELQEVRKKKEKYGQSNVWKGKKIMVEFTDPNPFKEFHIGHLYSNIIGECLCRLFQAQGAIVKRANYQGDVGLHVAKAILGMQIKIETEREKPKDSDPLSKKVRWLGRCYALGSGGDPSVGGFTFGGSRELFVKHEQQMKIRNERVEADELERINKAVYEKSDPEINQLYDMGKKWSLEYFKEIYKRLGTKFDYYYFESEVGETGLTLVQKGLERGIFEKSQGAVIFPGEKYGLHSRVFINSLGLPTYEAKELGLAPTKYKDFEYDLSVIVTGNEIVDYFKVVLAALKEIDPSLAEKTRHLSHGMVRLPEGKISSRTGAVITAEALLEEVKSKVLQVMESSGAEIPAEEKDKTVEIIALGAVKYSLLRVSLGKDIIFDFDKSLSLQGESGPYLQYTYARCKSIARKAGISNFKFLISKQIPNLTKEELDILRTVYKFPEMVREAGEKFSPNLITNFVFGLAQRYNLFYNTHPVLKAETKEVKNFRLLLTVAVAQIIENSLSLLGIATPERM